MKPSTTGRTMRHRAKPPVGPAARTLRRTTHNLQRNTWPGLALAGGVLVAAIAALLFLGGGGNTPPDGGVPGATPPGNTRIFPGAGDVAGETESAPRHHHRPVRPALAGTVPVALGQAPGGSAATSQYGADGNRGTVFSSP
jgi:hypothetical protein